MKIGERLKSELENVLAGSPWYGLSVYDIIDKIPFSSAFENPYWITHSIAEILLHMTGWTEEIISRMEGRAAGLPLGGDWPSQGEPEEQKWSSWVYNFKTINESLLRVIMEFPEHRWSEPINDERNLAKKGVSYEALITGLAQHHVYHSGQISLLKTKVV